MCAEFLAASLLFFFLFDETECQLFSLSACSLWKCLVLLLLHLTELQAYKLHTVHLERIVFVVCSFPFYTE